MSKKILLPLGILAIVVAVLAGGALFTVQQSQQALVLQFGEPKRIITEPGLKAKIPFVQNVIYYERRVLEFNPPTERVLLADQMPLNVDSFARYRISDPLRFYQTVNNETNLRERMGAIINATLRGVLGNVNLTSVLSEERALIMRDIRQRVNEESRNFGVEVVDVRIGRTDLPQEVSQAVYSRMRTEREQEAAEFRAQGEEMAQRIRASADREATVIRAEAQRQSEIVRGEGDAERTRILGESYGQAPEFFRFYRTMEAYRESIDGENAYFVLNTRDSDFFRMMTEGVQTLNGGLGEASRPAPQGGVQDGQLGMTPPAAQ